MCIQKPPNDHSQQLYDRYREVIADYAKQTVSIVVVFNLCEYQSLDIMQYIGLGEIHMQTVWYFYVWLGVALFKGEAWWVYAERACSEVV